MQRDSRYENRIVTNIFIFFIFHIFICETLRMYVRVRHKSEHSQSASAAGSKKMHIEDEQIMNDTTKLGIMFLVLGFLKHTIILF